MPSRTEIIYYGDAKSSGSVLNVIVIHIPSNHTFQDFEEQGTPRNEAILNSKQLVKLAARIQTFSSMNWPSPNVWHSSFSPSRSLPKRAAVWHPFFEIILPHHPPYLTIITLSRWRSALSGALCDLECIHTAAFSHN